MKLSLITAAALAVFTLTASSAVAKNPLPPGSDGFIAYGVADGWSVYRDVERQSCMIQRYDDAMNLVQMGLTKNHKHSYIGVFTLADVDIKNRQKFIVVIDGNQFTGHAHGLTSKRMKTGYSGGYVIIKDDTMITAVENGHTMIVFPKKTDAFEVNLDGTKEAIDLARRCNLDATQ